MTSRELIRWARLHEARAQRGWWRSPIVAVVALAGALAAMVGARVEPGAFAHASRTWFVGALLVFAVTFLRAPFLIYWRADAPLLAQLPIAGTALFDAALVRCVRAAAIATVATALAAVPLATLSVELAVRHVAFAAALGCVGALGMPAVVMGAAATLQHGIVASAMALGGAPPPKSSATRTAAGLAAGAAVGAMAGARAGGAVAAATANPSAAGSSAMLGALPGFAATAIFVFATLASPWLAGEPTRVPGLVAIGVLVGASALAIVVARRGVGPRMGAILRDVSALDRQRLAALEIRPPTALERAIGTLTGDGALAYSKDARLVRRRFPMAFALGAGAFLVLAIVALARPADPLTPFVVAVGGAAAYAIVLSGRLRKPPIELARLSATLPIEPAAQRRAKHAWLVGWWVVFVVVPGAAALATDGTPVCAAVLGGATLAVLSREWLPERITSSRAASASGD